MCCPECCNAWSDVTNPERESYRAEADNLRRLVRERDREITHLKGMVARRPASVLTQAYARAIARREEPTE